MKNENKRLVLIMRVLLLCLGLMFGWGVAGLILTRQTVLTDAMQLVIRSVTAAVFAAAFFSLARPCSALVRRTARSLHKTVIEKPLYKSGSVVLGVAIGVMMGILASELVELFTAAWEVRLIVSFIVAVASAYVGYLVCSRWLKSEEESITAPEREYHGYVLSYGAFFSDRLNCFTQLANGPILLTGKTLNRLITLSGDDAEAKAALDRYISLSDLGAIRIVDMDDDKTETEQIVFLAKSRQLKVITALPGEITADGIKILPLSDL